MYLQSLTFCSHWIFFCIAWLMRSPERNGFLISYSKLIFSCPENRWAASCSVKIPRCEERTDCWLDSASDRCRKSWNFVFAKSGISGREPERPFPMRLNYWIKYEYKSNWPLEIKSWERVSWPGQIIQFRFESQYAVSSVTWPQVCVFSILFLQNEFASGRIFSNCV